jgi:hypothetical protein
MRAYVFVVLFAAAAAGLALGIGARSGAGPVPSFAAPKSYATGRTPWAITSGDFNGDARPDLATANAGLIGRSSTGDSVSVFLNKGNGSFGNRHDYPTGKAPVALAAGDLNGDGRTDLATANSNVGNVSVLLNSGGGFQPKRDYLIRGVPYDPLSVSLGDLNGDGKLDLIAAGGGSSTVSVLLNKGDGTFAAGRDYATGSFAQSVALADVDGDGSPDIATADNGATTVSVLLNRGDGSFQAKRDWSVGGRPGEVALGDVDGDGKPDLVASTASNSVSVLLNEGGGSFKRPRRYRTGVYPHVVAIADLTGDTKPDLAVATPGRGASSVSVLANRGDGRFAPKVEFRVKASRAPGPLSVVLADLTGDGKRDLATANFVANTVSVLRNRPGLCTVQDVHGNSMQTAKQTLAHADCRVGTIRRAYSKTVRRGRVVSQRPSFGALLPASAKVNLVVSRGRKR